jgi:predicted nuclease of restriction endonuclease-like (RecB) superfamily
LNLPIGDDEWYNDSLVLNDAVHKKRFANSKTVNKGELLMPVQIHNKITNTLDSKIEKDFSEILKLIQNGRSRALSAINVALIDTYWAVGSYLSRKVANAGWGKGVVKELAQWLCQKAPGIKGSQNLWRMKQFFETYNGNEKLSALLRELSWTNHCIIIAQCKAPEEQMFYLQTAARARWSSRELESQIRKLFTWHCILLCRCTRLSCK